MSFGEIARVVIAFLVAIYWVYTATAGWERYMALNPRWIRKKWQALALAGVAIVFGVTWLMESLGITF